MSVVHAGAPVFTVGGDPGSVESRVGDLRVRAERFVAVGDALGSVSTSGWSGRAADRFRERFEVEPERWRTAGEGFFRAASALSGWADSLRWGQEQADWCRQEWARGDAETVRARAAYDADVAAGRAEKAWWEAQHGPGTFTLTVEPFVDPGAAVRDGAAAEFARVVQQLESAAHEAAAGVRAGCAGAPESRNWMESGLAFLGGVLTGAGEAVWDLGSMAVGLTFAPVFDLVDLATGDLTQEELLAKHQLKVEQAQALWEAATSDPWGFGLDVGRAVLDWDTWADDPARALGHLVPDAIAAVLSGGALAAATKGGKVLEAGGRIVMDLSGADLVRGGLRAAPELLDSLPFGNGRVYSMMDDVDHVTSFASEQMSGSRLTDSLLAKHGVTREGLIDMVNTPLGDLDGDQVRTIRAIHDDLRLDDSMVFQKALPPGTLDQVTGEPRLSGADAYIMGAERYRPDVVVGSVTVAGDTAHLDSVEAIRSALRLDYPGTAFEEGAASVHVLRFEVDNATLLEPSLASGVGGSGLFDTWKEPFTGNGFTKAADDLVPEYYARADEVNAVRMRPGAELWEITDTGTERLVAVLRGEEWVPVDAR